MVCERPLLRPAAFLLLSCWIHGDRARAQEILQSALGPTPNAQFGAAVDFGPDLDGDGFREVAVGAPTFDGALKLCGAVSILAGRDFSTLTTIVGSVLNGYSGSAVCWCGDVDGDGLPDLAIGAPGYAFGSSRTEGYVAIHSSSTWSQLRVLHGPTAFGWFGAALADAGDVNGDGIDDLLVGAPYDSTNGQHAGAMFLHSGADGSLLWSVHGIPYSELGSAVAAVGDVDDDGVGDFAVGEPRHDGAAAGDYAGLVEVYSGANGAVLLQWSGTSTWHYTSYWNQGWVGDQLGFRVGAAGDFDGDGTPDVWAASQRGLAAGGAYFSIFSGATGATIRTIVTPAIYQHDAAPIGDLNGDGLPEFVSCGRNSWGEAFVFSSVDGKVLWQIDDPSDFDSFTSVGRDLPPSTDLLLGKGHDNTVGQYAGKVELRASNDLWLDVAPTHFPAAKQFLTFTADEGPVGHPAALFLTQVNGAPHFALLALATFDAAGSAPLLTLRVPSGLTGTTLTLHAFAIGASGKLVDSIDELITLK